MSNINLSKPTEVIQLKNWSLLTNGLLCFIYNILLISVFVGNMLVITTVVTCKRFRRAPDYFIASLAIADLLMAFGPIPLASVITYYGYWPFEHEGWCTFWVGAVLHLSTASIYNLASMSVGRLMACIHPIRYRTTLRTVRVMLLITISWTIPCILLFASFANGTISASDGGKCFSRLELHIRASNTLISFVIPCAVATGSNLYILRFLHTRNNGNVSKGQNGTSVSLSLHRGSIPGGRITDSRIPQSRAQRKRPLSARFQLSLTNGGNVRPKHLIRRHKTTAFQMVLGIYMRKYAYVIHPSMIRQVMSIYFNQHVLLNNVRNELLLQITQNMNNSSTVYPRTTRAIMKSEGSSLKPTDTKCLSQDAQTSQPGISEDTFPVKTRYNQQIRTVVEPNSSNRSPTTFYGFSHERTMLDNFRSYIKQRANRCMLVVIICFLICWTPFMLCYFVEGVRGALYPPWFSGSLALIAFANSAFNPIVYALVDKRYRENFKTILRL